MPEDDAKCESFTIISIDSSLAYKNKYYLQVHLENCPYKTANNQMTDYLDENLFECKILQMLHYKRIDLSKGIDLAKSKRSKQCMICHLCFFNNGFKFRDSVYNGCHFLQC